MYLKFAYADGAYKRLENSGFRFVKHGACECYLQGDAFDSEWKPLDDIEVAELLQRNTQNLSALNGRFGGALVYAERRKILIFADRKGSYPIFYMTRGEKLYVSDKLFTLYAFDDFARENETSLATRMLYGYVLDRETLFENIYTLRAGTAALLEEGSRAPKTIRSDAVYRSGVITQLRPQEAAELIYYRLSRAIANIFENVPGKIAATLTGGADSRLVVAAAAQQGIAPELFCVDNDNFVDELKISASVGAALGRDIKLYPSIPDYYETYMDECFRRCEYGCTMHVWFKPFENIPEVTGRRVLMGLGGGELLRFNNGNAATQILTRVDKDEAIKLVLDRMTNTALYLKDEFIERFQKIARPFMESQLEKYTESERGLWDFCLDTNFFDAVDCIFTMYPHLRGISPYLDSGVLDFLLTLPCKEGYQGDELYGLLYRRIPAKIAELPSTRTEGIRTQLPRKRYLHNENSFRKVYGKLMQGSAYVDKRKVEAVFKKKTERGDYTFGAGELMLYQQLLMEEDLENIIL